MIPFEVDPSSSIPSRHSNPPSLALRLRRKRNQFVHQIRLLHLDYPRRLNFYAFIALFTDFFITSLGLHLLQRVHQKENIEWNQWQHVVPTLCVGIIYLIPVLGVHRRSHLLLLLHVSLTSLYLFFMFVLTIRATYKAHFGHYFYRVHHCPTRFVASDSLLCIVALFKFVLLWPVHRCYMHSRDCLEFSYYMKREVRNTYGLVEFRSSSKGPKVQDSNGKIQECNGKVHGKSEKLFDSQPNLYTTTPTTMEPSQLLIDSLAGPVYENAEIGIGKLESSVESLLNDINDKLHFMRNEDSESELEVIDGEDLEDEEQVLGDCLDSTSINSNELGPFRNPVFGV